MLTQFRCLKRRFLILCFFAVCFIWYHCNTSVQMVGSVFKAAKGSSEWAIVQGWARQVPLYHHSSDEDRNEVGEDTHPGSHPFDNLCQYPVLRPDDENLRHVAKHIRLHVCKKVQPDVLTFDYDRGELIIDRAAIARFLADGKLRCQYRSFSGGIRPRITEIVPTSAWKPVISDRTLIGSDLIETKCFVSSKVKNGTAGKEIEVFRNAFGHIVKRVATTGKNARSYIENNETTLSIDFLFLDSTALNVMKRHMSKTWKYMKEEMGFFHLEGYSKVGDNSMVNLMPILAGLRYGNQSTDMPSEVPANRAIDAEPLPLLWKLFRERGCATLFNDDIAHYTRGFFNYPWTHFKGFAEYPTDHFTRPWHIHHRRYPINGSSKFCFGNTPYYVQQLHFLEQMIKKYKDICHFSFNFITDLPHDDPNNLEMADDYLQGLLKRIYTGDYLNNTALFIMGDHGNRIGYVMYSYIGRIEERMSLFSVYLPEWYRRKHPAAMRQLQINKHRLTSNYDVYRTIREIFNNTLSKTTDPPIHSNIAASKAISLFRPISVNRTCAEANIPPAHCVCLEPVPPWSKSFKLSSNHSLYQQGKELVLNWTRLRLESTSANCSRVKGVEILTAKFLTTSQMIQHGVRDLSPDQTKKLKRKIDGEIEYIDLVYKMIPINVTARTRLQYYKRPKAKLIFNIAPYQIAEGRKGASWEKCVARNSSEDDTAHQIPWFCRCVLQS